MRIAALNLTHTRLTNFKLRQIVQSADGSHTIFLPDLKEHFHSIHGALQESFHVFIQQGFLQVPALDEPVLVLGGPVSILEVGFGTGLNGLLTLLYAQAKGIRVRYTALEAYPLQEEEYLALNYPGEIAARPSVEQCGVQDGGPFGIPHNSYSRAMLGSMFTAMHAGAWERPIEPVPGFVLEKRRVLVEEAELLPDQFDLVYFDAFAPRVQPGVWTMQVFEKIFSAMKPGGLLVTYSATGDLKRTLKGCGFVLEHPAGPPGKREMTRALKP